MMSVYSDVSFMDYNPVMIQTLFPSKRELTDPLL